MSGHVDALEVSMVASRPALDNREPAGKQEVRLR